MRFKRVAFGMLAGLVGLLAACGSDTAGSQSKEPLRLTVNLPQAYVGEAYNVAITADGGIRPYKYTFDGTLPKGLTYADGRISGTPQEKGSFDLTVTVEDGNLSSKVQKATLTVGETPPPQLEQVFPLAESADPFVYLIRVRSREAKGFQMQLALKDLKPTLESMKSAEGLLAVSRYNPETRLLDVDAVFVTPKKDLEMLRLTLTPDKKLRPSFGPTNPLLAFYDKNGALVAGNPQIDRAPSEGKYKYADLQAIARNWGRKLSTSQGTPPQQGQAAPAGNPAQAPQETQSQAQPGPAQTDGQNAQTQSGSPAGQTQTPASGPAASGQTANQPQAPANSQNQAQGQQNQSAQGQPGSNVQAAQGQQPTPGQTPAQTQNGQIQPTSAQTQKLEGDLNGDGVVDQKDLDLLRSSYAWTSVAGVKQPASQTPANPQNPNQPPGQNPDNPNQQNNSDGKPPAPSNTPPNQ
jgi:hypothetical protein